jgi:alpha-2-macroglobulin-like protein
MVMALQFLKAQPPGNANVQGMILQIEGKLKPAYDKLVSFKTIEKGYEWFGDSPAHEALSSMGLMQFTDMAKVTSIVDQKMVSDLQTWLLSRRNESSGLFQMNPKALDSFGRAPDNITSAYIVWALTSSGVTNLTNEIAALMNLADA